MSIEKSLESIAASLEKITHILMVSFKPMDPPLADQEPPKKKKASPKAKPAPEKKEAEFTIADVRKAAKLLIDAYPKKDCQGFKEAQKILIKFGAAKMVDLKPEQFEAVMDELEKEAKSVKK